MLAPNNRITNFWAVGIHKQSIATSSGCMLAHVAEAAQQLYAVAFERARAEVYGRRQRVFERTVSECSTRWN
jgi:hypothetical protein